MEDSRALLYLTVVGMLALVVGFGGYLHYQLKYARVQVGEQHVKLRELDQSKNKSFSNNGHDLSNPLVVRTILEENIAQFKDIAEDKGTRLVLNTGRPASLYRWIATR